METSFEGLDPDNRVPSCLLHLLDIETPRAEQVPFIPLKCMEVCWEKKEVDTQNKLGVGVLFLLRTTGKLVKYK